ncbi:MAG: alanine racemase [candidate division Zixibacteria bacterium]|nr:alanine racemase [candidate division Zixibacteria bacterium]
MRVNRFNKPSYIEIDLDRIADNTKSVKSVLPEGVTLQAVVKANGYGHGAVEAARTMVENGADCLGVAFVEEGIELREAGITKPIVLLYPEPSDRAYLVLNYNLIPTISDIEFARELDRVVDKGKRVDVFLKIDTGMSRYGAKPEEISSFVRNIKQLPKLRIAGFSTNFSASDNGDLSFCYKQMERFKSVTESFKDAEMSPKVLSMANSGGLLNLPESYFNMVRVGLLLYGYYSSKESKRTVDVKPVLKLVSKILYIRELDQGEPIGYGLSYVTQSKSKIATIPIGYGDGYPRAMSNKGEVLINGRRASIVGRICMDALMVDITDVPQARVGDEVVLIGEQRGEYIGADEIAELCGTITWEITCGFTHRLPIKYIHSNVSQEVIKA